MDKQEFLRQLHTLICEHFDKEDLRLLCFQLGVKYENLAGDKVDTQALSLVEMMDDLGRILDLHAELENQRPNIDWPPLPEIIAQEAESKLRVYEFGRYNLGAKFVGRKTELAELDAWLTDTNRPMYVVVALGGTGKSALTWHWLEKVKEMDEPPFAVVIWHGFYETGRIDDFLTDVLQFLGEDPQKIGSKRLQLNRLRERLEATPTLLILDGAERLLRAYSGMNAAYQADEAQAVRRARECVDPVAGDLLVALSQLGNGSKTLITSRLLPQELLDRGGNKLPDTIGRRDLTGLDPEDALRFFSEWGIQTTRAEVHAACQPLDYHPFCMALLAGIAANDFAAPNDLRAVADYDPTHDLLGRRQHILHRAYDNLPPAAQLTLGRLAAFRAAVTWETTASTLGGTPETQADLHLLEQRGLLQRSQPISNAKPAALTFNLHPIVRRYAYNRLTDPKAFHNQLISYFEAIPQQQEINSLADLTPTIELYHHLTRAERYDEAFTLYRDQLQTVLFYQMGTYQQIIELLLALFPEEKDKLPRLSDESTQAWTLNELANSCSLAGQSVTAVPLFQQAIDMAAKQGNKKNTPAGLSNLAIEQIRIGMLAKAADNLYRSIVFCEENEDRVLEVVGRLEYGRLLTYCGNWEDSVTELDAAQVEFDRLGPTTTSYVSVVREYQAFSALLQGDGVAAQNEAQEALNLADETARTHRPHERDYVRAHWLLGWAALVKDNHQESQTHLDEALRRCRVINLVDHEPAILLAHARLARAQASGGAGLVPAPSGRSHTGQPQGLPLQRSIGYAQQALTIAERSGYVLNLADIHNHLALDAGDIAAARAHAQSAHDYAYCDGPPYTYHTALTEAKRILTTL